MFPDAGDSAAGQMDISSLSNNDKQDIQHFVQNEQQKADIQQSESMASNSKCLESCYWSQADVHNLANMCFQKCITGTIRDGKLDRYEEPCVQNCVQRFMDMNGVILQNLSKMGGAWTGVDWLYYSWFEQ